MIYSFAPVVLVVEDEALIRIVAADAFLDAGFIVLEAESAAHALIVVSEAERIHLLFTDVNMPGVLNGIDLAEQLWARTPGLHIIITSALPILRPISHMGATFAPKPYSTHEVCQTALDLLAA